VAAEKVESDRCDPAAAIVLETSWKVWKETDRLFGLLRFSPSPAQVHVARCTPDHFVLPALADHFALRFGGGTPWAIIDERRGMALYCAAGGEPLIAGEPLPEFNLRGNDPWENLWRGYHQTINNESRSNPDLQRQFMPRRYWKYLPEMQ
jgi:probable DNA metabolism protein